MIKKGFGFFVVFLFVIFISSTVEATPPKSVTLEYNSSSHVLTVTIEHKSPFPTRHYIKNVTIKKNGEMVAPYTYTSQPDKTRFTYTYPVAAEQGDKLDVTAKCSLFGSKTEQIVVNPGKN